MNKQNTINCLPLFENFITKCLIIVDVQEPFKKWWIKNGKDSLVDDINEYCLNFNKVYQIWDDHDADSPSYTFNNEFQTIRKHFGVDKSDGELDNLEEIFDSLELQKVNNILNSDIIEQTLFKTKTDEYAILVNGSHKWFFPSKELTDAVNNINSDIILVGGAEGECLYDIEVMLKLLNKKFSVNLEYTYNAQDEAKINK